MPLQTDFDLQSTDLQELSSRDQVVAFFARLGYDVGSRLPQTSEAMGLNAAGIQRDVKHIERIADHDDGGLQVYLAELKSVTMANVQAIARSLRVRAGWFLC